MNRLAAWLTAFLDDLRQRRMAAVVNDYDAELRRIRDMRAHCDVAECIVAEKRQRAAQALYLIQRKGKA